MTQLVEESNQDEPASLGRSAAVAEAIEQEQLTATKHAAEAQIRAVEQASAKGEDDARMGVEQTLLDERQGSLPVQLVTEQAANARIRAAASGEGDALRNFAVQLQREVELVYYFLEDDSVGADIAAESELHQSAAVEDQEQLATTDRAADEDAQGVVRREQRAVSTPETQHATTHDGPIIRFLAHCQQDDLPLMVRNSHQVESH